VFLAKNKLKELHSVALKPVMLVILARNGLLVPGLSGS